MALRKRLKEMELRLTELCDYMQVSRPTMYKYMESYDRKDFDEISSDVLKVFNYIAENKLAGKKNVVSFILNDVIAVKGEDKTINVIKKYIDNNPTSEKSKFFELIARSDNYDSIIHYLLEIKPLLNKKSLTSAEKEKLKPYNLIIKGGK